jgi:kynurenine formamidase
MAGVIVWARLVEMSYVLGPGVPVWPGDPPVQFETVATIEREGYALRRLSMGEHSGTHLSAPCSFDPQGKSMTEHPDGARLVVPAVVVDVRSRAANDPDYVLVAEDVLAWETRHGRVPENSLVILFSGWGQWWRQEAFLNVDAAGKMHFPGMSEDAARLLMEERSVAGVGTDTHGIDPGRDRRYATSKLVLGRGGMVIENLRNVHELPPLGATLVIGVLRLEGGTGSPAAVLALVP